MRENLLKSNISSETMSAVFIIAAASLFILANFTVGFSLPLWIVAMSVSFLIAFCHPRSGIYAIVFLTVIFERFFTLQPILVRDGEYKLYPLDVILGAVILGTIFKLVSRKVKLRLKRPDYYLIGFIFLSAAYFLGSVFILGNDFALAFSSFKNYAFYSLVYFLILFLFDKKEYAIRLFKFFFSAAVILIGFIIYGLLARHGLWSDYTPLSTEGFRTLAFTHAFYLGLSVLGALAWLAFNKQKFSSGAYLTLILIWLLGIVGSMMRHLWVGLGVAAIALYFAAAGKQRNFLGNIALRSAAALAIIVIVALYLSVMFPHSYIAGAASSTGKVIETRFSSIFSASDDESFSWRNLVWTEGMKEYRKNPIFGLGLGQRIYVEGDNYREFVEVRNVHNSLLVIFFQFGIVPFLVFLAFVYGNVKEIFRRAKKTWIDAALIAFAVYYLVIFLFQPYLETNLLGIFFWIILGLIAVRSRITVIPSVVEESNQNKN